MGCFLVFPLNKWFTEKIKKVLSLEWIAFGENVAYTVIFIISLSTMVGSSFNPSIYTKF